MVGLYDDIFTVHSLVSLTVVIFIIIMMAVSK